MIAMKKINKKKFWRWVKAIVFTYLALGVALYFLQEKFLFHPEKLAQDYRFQFNIPFEEINVPLGRGSQPECRSVYCSG